MEKCLRCLLFILVFLVCVRPEVSGQECSGNFGENIFVEGDFGTGMQNILPFNPGYAPGYIYTTNPPPDDGFYTLTNNMALWNNTFPAWIAVQDNSADPAGYMMVVNASFAPGIFYEQIVDDLCENTVYQFSADVINLIRRGTNAHIQPNLSFLIDDNEIFSTGSVPQEEEWLTYSVAFATLPGQTSVKLTLRNNAPGGIGNDLALDNIRFRPCGPAAATLNTMPGKICENSLLFPVLTAVVDGESIDTAVQWQFSDDGGTTWTDIPGANDFTYAVQQLAAGTYAYRFLWAASKSSLQNAKCRINSDPVVVEVVPLEYAITDTICRGLAYQLGDTTYTETGVYTENLISSIGCDSIVTLNLFVWDPEPIDAVFIVEQPGCAGDADGTIAVEDIIGLTRPLSWNVNGLDYAIDEIAELAAGLYTVTITDRYGCTLVDDVEVTDPPVFKLNPLPDTTVVLGYAFQPFPAANLPIGSMTWYPSQFASCSPCLSPELSPPESTLFTAVGTSEKGCLDSVRFQIFVEQETRLYVPNAFSPNMDGINDTWLPLADPVNIREIRKLVITDRWGAVVKEASHALPDDPLLGWDGTFRGQMLQSGVYAYYVHAIRVDGTDTYLSGTITLIR